MHSNKLIIIENLGFLTQIVFIDLEILWINRKHNGMCNEWWNKILKNKIDNLHVKQDVEMKK